MIPTICPICGHEYQERDEASAARPDRMCSNCWSAQARKFQERVPQPEKRIPNTCRTSGKELVWMKTASGKNMPVDSETAEPGDELFNSKKHTSHFATCPQAGEHRRVKR